MRTLLRSLVVVALLLVAGCGGAGADTASDDALTESAGAADGGGEAGFAGEGGAELDAEAPADASGGVVTAVEDRQFITEGSVTVTVESPRAAARAVAQMVERLGGHVQERVEQGTDEDENASAYLVVRIPSTEVTGALEQLASLGTVEDTSITSTEVTAQARDLDARIRALEISAERLEDLLSRATTTEAIVSAEQALTERQSELESLMSQRNRLADQVALSTIRVDLWTEDTVPPEPATGFWGGLVTGWNSLVATVTGLLLALGVILPWALAVGLVLLLVLAARRRLGRPDRSGPTATAPSGPAHSPGPTSSPAPAASPAATSTPVADLAATSPDAGAGTAGGAATAAAADPAVSPEPSSDAEQSATAESANRTTGTDTADSDTTDGGTTGSSASAKPPRGRKSAGPRATARPRTPTTPPEA